MKWTLPLLALTALLVTSCGPSTRGGTDGCEWTRTIYLDPDDKLTRETEDAVLSHNEARSKICAR